MLFIAHSSLLKIEEEKRGGGQISKLFRFFKRCEEISKIKMFYPNLLKWYNINFKLIICILYRYISRIFMFKVHIEWLVFHKFGLHIFILRDFSRSYNSRTQNLDAMFFRKFCCIIVSYFCAREALPEKRLFFKQNNCLING